MPNIASRNVDGRQNEIDPFMCIDPRTDVAEREGGGMEGRANEAEVAAILRPAIGAELGDTGNLVASVELRLSRADTFGPEGPDDRFGVSRATVRPHR
ncbi:MAG: hypothetical protein R3C97_07525 [Geminicoccaceae bacterium]